MNDLINTQKYFHTVQYCVGKKGRIFARFVVQDDLHAQ